MKLNKKFKSSLAILVITLFVFCFTGVKTLFAAAKTLVSGEEVAVSSLNGNLNNINLKFEFSTSVNLDGENNALLVGLVASDGTKLTDQRFVAASTTQGVMVGDVVVNYTSKVPAVIGTKTGSAAPYTYSFESRDFTVVNGTKDIAKLVVVGQKGTEIETEVSVSEVKYSVKFGDAAATDYSYNAVIVAPASTPAYTFDATNHQEVLGWKAADESLFVSGTSKATKDLVYSLNKNTATAHNWQDVTKVDATTDDDGVKAHQTCTCGALRISADEPALVSESDLVIPALGHTHVYTASFDWTNATNPGDKPVVKYTCECQDVHTMDAADVTINEKADSRQNATCQATGSVTYVASCTYADTPASEEKQYTLAITSHSAVHHDAVTPSLKEAGNIEYWTCEVCKGYFLDAACTQATTAEAVALAKYTTEAPQYISVSDLKYDGASSLSIKNESKNYDYDLTNAPANKSVVFFANIDYKAAQGSQIYIYGDEGANWNTAGYVWIQQKSVFIGRTNEDGTAKNSKQVDYGFDLEVGKVYSIEYGRLAIMNGNTFTGKYHVYFKLNNNELYSIDQAIESAVASGGRVHFTGAGGFKYVDGYEQETAKQISVSDLLKNGSSVGTTLLLSENRDLTYNNDDHSDNYSLVFKAQYYVDELTERQFHFVSSSTNYNNLKWWGLGGFIIKSTSTHIGKMTTVTTENKGFHDNKNFTLTANTLYNIEYGRIALMRNGVFTGKYYTYAKVNGEIVNEAFGVMAADVVSGNAVFITGKAQGGYNRISDICTDDICCEEPDIISVNDLYNTDGYLNGSMYLLKGTNGELKYSFNGSSEYGSTVFKGKFNFKATNFNNGDNHGTQIRFLNGWGFEGAFWIHPTAGTIIYKLSDDNGSVGYAAMTAKLPTDRDVEVECGRLAIMDAQGEFTGNFYFYISFDGKLVGDYIATRVTEADYTGKYIFFTGKDGNGDNVIKNVEIKKTVTLKIGTNSVDVETLRSGLVTIPELDETVLPSYKKITGWTIEGTETAFDPSQTRIFDDMTIVATVEDYNWSVKFGDDDATTVGNGVEITAPADPTKDYDATNHYVFDGWYDGETKFVAGTKASKNVTYTAKFTTVSHSYGDWVVDQANSCESTGLHTHTCTCGHSVQEVIPAGHNLTHHEAVSEDCENDGNIEYWTCSGCQKVFADEACTEEITLASTVIAAHHKLTHHTGETECQTSQTAVEYWSCEWCHNIYGDEACTQKLDSTLISSQHTLTHHDAVAEDCENDGNIEYWSCSACNKVFADEACTEKITLAETVIAKHHNLTHHDAVAEDCENDGNVEYWSCSACHKNYGDEACTQELTEVVIAKHHNLTHHDAVAEDCENDGNVEYWSCSACQKNYADEACTQELANVVVAKHHGEVVHHAAKAASVESAGNLEYWYCPDCETYYLNEACTQATTLEAVTLAQYTTEAPQYITILDLSYNGTVADSVKNESKNYDYSLDGAPANKSVVFVATLNYKGEGNSQIYIYGDASQNWNGAGYIWIYGDHVHFGVNGEDGKQTGNTNNAYDGFTLEVGKKYTIEYGRLAIMNGDTFTGKYHVYFKINGKLINSLDQAIESSVASGGRVHFTGNGAFTYESAYELETAKEISVSDLLSNGKSIGISSVLTAHGNYTYDNEDHAENYSLVFKAQYYVDEPAERQFHFVNSGDNYETIKWGGLSSFIIKANTIHIGKGNTTAVTKGFFDGKYSTTANTLYDIEYGRIALKLNGQFTGRYYTYLKINDEVVISKIVYLPLEVVSGNAVFMTGNKENGGLTRLIDSNVQSMELEEADVISVNDLYREGSYLKDTMSLTENLTYGYEGTSAHGSTVFKGVFNINSANFANGDTSGTQIRFTMGWGYEGALWIQPAGTFVYTVKNDAGDPVLAINSLPISTDKDVLVEFGRKAILENGEFTGKFYFYVSFDGKIVGDYIAYRVPEDAYTNHYMFFTGKEGNGNNIIKNVEITKTVTIKVGTYSEQVNVQRSSLLTIPSYGTDVVPSDKRIVKWVIEGTETEFDASKRILNDMTIVAVIDDFKYAVQFGEEVVYIKPNQSINAPETIPTKACDADNHFVFDGWYDGEDKLDATTVATKDVVYEAKFVAVAHTYGEWSVVNEPDCENTGLRERTCSCGYVSQEVIPTSHNLVHFDAIAETCTTDGRVEFWGCSLCHKMFADAEGTQEITDVVIAKHHTLGHVVAVAETCTTDGRVEFWGCSLCHKMFADAEGTQEITNVAIAKHHVLTHVDAVESDCENDGNVEHWHCSVCGKNYADENASEVLATVVVEKHHELTYVAGRAATCDEGGYVEYWHCSECGKNFDANGTQLTSLIVPAREHLYGVDHKCIYCGADDPDYVPEVEPKTNKLAETLKAMVDSYKEAMGCKSSVASGSMIFVLLGAAAILFDKKRKAK